MLPLDGVRILDCSRVLAGPFATMLLADLGATVWKLEPPGGDESRGWGPPFWGDLSDGLSAYFASVNRNKRSLVMDLRSESGRELLDRLAERADLLIHNYRPDTAERLGLGSERLADRFPRLGVVAIGGFPDGRRPAYDLLAQAVSGLMAVSGDPDGPPTRIGVAVLDLIAGLEAAVGGLAALIGRERPSSVSVGLVEAGVSSLVNVLGNFLASSEEPARHGNEHPNIVPYQAFETRDGTLVVAVGNDRQFRALLDVLRLADDSRFATNPQRVAGRAELIPILASRIADRGRDELVAGLLEADVPAGPVNSVGEAIAAMGPGWIREIDGVRLPPSPIRIAGAELPIQLRPPRLGEHTEEILREAGVSDSELAAARAAGAIFQAESPGVIG